MKKMKFKSKHLVFERINAGEISAAGINPTDGGTEWTAPFRITLKAEPEKTVGFFAMAGEPVKGAVQVNINIEEEYNSEEYCGEILKAAEDCAFFRQDVYIITVKADSPALAAAVNGRKYTCVPESENLYRKDKEQPLWMAIYMCMGIGIGTSIGSAAGNVGIGMCFGISIGMLLGILIDRQEKKRRAEITGENE